MTKRECHMDDDLRPRSTSFLKKNPFSHKNVKQQQKTYYLHIFTYIQLQSLLDGLCFLLFQNTNVTRRQIRDFQGKKHKKETQKLANFLSSLTLICHFDFEAPPITLLFCAINSPECYIIDKQITPHTAAITINPAFTPLRSYASKGSEYAYHLKSIIAPNRIYLDSKASVFELQAIPFPILTPIKDLVHVANYPNSEPKTLDLIHEPITSTENFLFDTFFSAYHLTPAFDLKSDSGLMNNISMIKNNKIKVFSKNSAFCFALFSNSLPSKFDAKFTETIILELRASMSCSDLNEIDFYDTMLSCLHQSIIAFARIPDPIKGWWKLLLAVLVILSLNLLKLSVQKWYIFIISLSLAAGVCLFWIVGFVNVKKHTKLFRV